MAIKVNAKNVLNIDLSSELKNYDANKMTSLNSSNYIGYSFNINGTTLTITNGTNTIRILKKQVNNVNKTECVMDIPCKRHERIQQIFKSLNELISEKRL